MFFCIKRFTPLNFFYSTGGLFWRAYEHSAFLFIKTLKKYSLTKKFYKNIEQEVIYLGFPKSAFLKIEEICTEKKLRLNTEDEQIKITGFDNFLEREFANWKNAIPLCQSLYQKKTK